MTMRYLSLTLCTLILCIGSCLLPNAYAQEADLWAEDISVQRLHLESELLQAKLEADTAIDEESQQQLLALIKSVHANSEQINLLREKAAKDEKAAEQAQEKSEQSKQELKKLSNTPATEVQPSIDLAELEVAAAKAEREAKRLKEELAAIEQKIADRNDIRLALSRTFELVSERLLIAEENFRSLPVEDGTLRSTAQYLEARATVARLKAERRSVDAEQKRLEAEDAASLFRNQRDLKDELINRAQEYHTNLQKLLDEKQQSKAETLAETAAQKQESIRTKFPELVDSYKFNTEIARRGQEVELRVQEITNKRDELKRDLESLITLKRETESRVDEIGLSGSVGAMLRKRRDDLPLQVATRYAGDSVKAELEDIQFERFDLEQQRSLLSENVVVAEVKAAAPELDVKTPEDSETPSVKMLAALERLKALEAPIDELISARKERISAADDSLDRLFERLLEIQSTKKRLEVIKQEFREYINERILWIRSNDLLFSKFAIDESDQELFKIDRWSSALSKIWGVIQRSPLLCCLSGLFIFLLLLYEKRMQGEVDRLGQVAGKGTCVTFWPTFHALYWTVLIAISVPLIPLLLGIGIGWHGPSGDKLFDAIGTGLLTVAWFAFPMEILRRMCRTAGLANIHFDWPDKSVRHLKRNLDWVVLPSGVIVFAIALLYGLDAAHRVDLIERVLFVVGMGVLLLFLYRTFDPKTGIFSGYLKANENSWASQLSWVWFGFILLVPVALAVLAIWGYYYTALNLSSCTYATFVFALIIETIRALLRRLVLLSRRRVHIQAARRKRALQLEAQLAAEKVAQKAEKEAAKVLALAKEASSDQEIDPSKLPPPATAPIPTVESLIDLLPVDEIDDNALRATKLIGMLVLVAWGIGLWVIWTDVLPALKALDRITLWSTDVVQTVTLADSTSTNVPSMSLMNSASLPQETLVEGKRWVTVRDLLSSIVIGLLTLIGARNFPAAIEVLFLEHLPVDRSFRYATKALTSYAIIMVGMVLAFGALSISWDNVQWLATALTFGLAFGLQEIFANFVAGIILMFERPIRIGDWITVDEFTGVVTKIRTRATTIVNWDRKEYVIPNKDFITGRLVNWTLSDAINRIVIKVGVAYGTDIIRAKKMLQEICDSHPKTVSDPSAIISLEEFGDSSLNLVARAFLGDVESRISVLDDLHTQVNQAFVDAGIEISFPQRDLHVRSVDGAATSAFFKPQQ